MLCSFSVQRHCQGSCNFPSTRWISYGLSWKTCSSCRRTLTLLSIEGLERWIFVLGGNIPNCKTAKQNDECKYIHHPLTIRWLILLKRLNIFFFHSVVVYVFSNFICGLKMFLPRVVKPFYSVEYWFPEGRKLTQSIHCNK